jgi:hypothetical protein
MHTPAGDREVTEEAGGSCNQALAQHVLHRLREFKVDTERKRGHELRQARVRTLGLALHAPSYSRHLGSERA